jgi:hypothetical protein
MATLVKSQWQLDTKVIVDRIGRPCLHALEAIWTGLNQTLAKLP